MTLSLHSRKLAFSLWNKSLLLILVCFLFGHINAQSLAAFHDNQNRFYIFDQGKTVEAEYLPVKGFVVGGDRVLYVDNTNHLKMYYKGNITTESVNPPEKYMALDRLSVYSIGGLVKIIDGPRTYTVSTHSIMYDAQDHLVAFYDAGQSMLAVYYEGRVHMLEDGLVGYYPNRFTAGDNIVAYISSRTQDLRIFYQGENRSVEPFSSGGSLRAGKDVVAFVNNADSKFRIFYKGEVMDAEDFPPESCVAGDGNVAYVDHTGSFRIFSGGETETLSSVKPDFYKVQDGMVLYGERGYFKVWLNNEVYTLETFIPNEKEIQADWNTVVYIDVNRNVKVFQNGETKVLTYDLAESVHLYRDVIVVNKGMNNHNVYWRGKKY